MKKRSYLHRTLTGVAGLNFFLGGVWMFVLLSLNGIHPICSSVFGPISSMAWLAFTVNKMSPKQEQNILVEQMAAKHRRDQLAKDTIGKIKNKKGKVQ